MGKHYVIEHMEPDEESAKQPIPEWALLEYRHILFQVGIYNIPPHSHSPSQSQSHEKHNSDFESPVPSPTTATLSSSSSFANLKDLVQSQVTFSHLSRSTCEALINGLASYKPPKNQSTFTTASAATTTETPSTTTTTTNSMVKTTTTNDRPFRTPIIRHLQSFSNINPTLLKSPDHVTCSVLSIMDLMSALKINIRDICLLDPKSTEALSTQDRVKFKIFLFGGILGDDPPRDRTAQLRHYGFPTRHLGTVQMTTDTAVALTKRVVEDGIELDQLDYVDRPELKFGKGESVEMPFRYLKASNGEPIMPEGMKALIHKDMDKSFEF